MAQINYQKIIFLLFVAFPILICDEKLKLPGQVEDKKPETKSTSVEVTKFRIDLGKTPVNKDEPEIKVVKKNETVDTGDKIIMKNAFQTPGIESGAFKRGVIVFVSCAMLFIAFVGYKTCKNRGKTPNVIKYGVRGKRSDMEMRPLPLEEDEDDETIFDLKHVNRN